MFLGVLLLLLAVAGFSQPCRVDTVDASFWPQDVPPPPGGRINSILRTYRLEYAFGKYFMGADWSENGETRYVSVVANRPGVFRRVLGKDGDPGFAAGPLLSVVFARGVWVARHLKYGIVSSRDGVHWQPTGAPLLQQIHWDGQRFLGQSFLYGFGVSETGESWEYLAEVPATIYSCGVPDGSRYVFCSNTYTSFQCTPGYTHDFQNWTWGTPPDFSGWFIWPYTVGHGFYWAQGPFEEQLSRSRDGLSWEPLPFVSHPLEARPRNLYANYLLAGRHLFGLAKLFSSAATDGLTHLILAKTDGRTWTTREVWSGPPTHGASDERGRFNLEGGQAGDIKWGILPAWDGKRLWTFLFKERLVPPPDPKTWVQLDEMMFLGVGCADLGDPVVFPGVARGEGAPGSFWKTGLSLTYPGQQHAEVLLQWLPFGQENRSPQERRLWLNTGQTLEFADVVGELFGSRGAGSVRLVHVRGASVVASVRTYNESSGGTAGQEIPGWSWEDGVGPGEDAWLSGLSESPSLASGFRSNVGIQNLWEETVEVEVVFFDAEGRQLGKLEKRLGPFEGVQWFRPLSQLVPGGAEGVSAVVRILHGNDSRIAVWGSKVDNRSGDPTTLRAVKLPYQGRPFQAPCPQGCPPSNP